MTAVYLLLLRADPAEQEDTLKLARQPKGIAVSTGGSKPRRMNSNKPKEEAKSLEDSGLSSPIYMNNKNSGSLSLHIDIQIHVSPDTSLEQIDRIFASMEKYLYKKEA